MCVNTKNIERFSFVAEAASVATAGSRARRPSWASSLLQMSAVTSLTIGFVLTLQILLFIDFLVLFNKLASGELLVSVVSDEFFDDHVAASDSNHQLSIHDLCEDPPRAKVVVPVSKSFDRYLAMH